MSQHRLVLGGGWTLWREVELRSAGFAAAWVDSLADVVLADASDGQAFANAQHDASLRLRELACAPSFREAVTWQNRRALHGSIASLLRAPEGHTSSKVRRDELLVASYAQRYCCKNERAGFFGASTPASIVDAGPALSVTPGPRLIAHRAVYLEPWAIEALADRIASDAELRPDLAPRRLPTIRLEGTTLVHSVDRRAELPPAFARLLAACDGQRPARAIAEQLASEPDLELASVDEVYEMLEELVDERVIIWTLELPTTGGPPEQLLRRELGRLRDSRARARALAALDELESARDVVAAAAGSVERLDHALAVLDQTFETLTGQTSVRSHGESYAGRTIVGEDCVRDVEVALGPPLVNRLAGALQLVLHSARWYTYEIARRYRAEIGALYRELRGNGPPGVDYTRFYARLPELFPGTIIPAVVSELQARWREVLGIIGSERIVERSVDELRAAVDAAFSAPHPGWPAARHHSPDVLLAARDVAAVNRGEYLAVLGEIHVGMNSLLVPAVPNSRRDPDAPFELRDLDVDQPTVAPVWSRRRSRIDYYSRSPRDYDLEHSAARSWRPRDQVLAIADLVLEDRDGALVVHTRDDRVVFDVIAFLEHYLLANTFSEFSLLAGRGPRVVVDGVVLSRERWVVPAGELAFAHMRDARERFGEANAWARAHGLPRRVFIKIPEETKPLYLDFASPTFVELAAKMIRKASRVSISEMLPDLDQLWLVDAGGARYTSELRIVAVDPEPWVPMKLDSRASGR